MTIEIPLSWIVFPLAALLVYFPCLGGPLIFDDIDIARGLKGFRWTRESIRNTHRPLTTLSFALQQLWPSTTRGLHVGNISIHSANGLIVEQIGEILLPESGWLAGLLFVVHPFAANSVAYITGRASLLSAGFGLSAAWAILAGAPMAALPLLLLSILAKEDGVGFLPLAALLGPGWFAASVAVLTAAGVVFYRKRLAALLSGNGDPIMAAIGLPTSAPQPKQGAIVVVETLLRLPAWAVGLATSPYHGSGINWSWLRALGAAFVLFAIGALLWVSER